MRLDEYTRNSSNCPWSETVVIRTSELQDFANFLEGEEGSGPIVQAHADGELLRAIIRERLLIVLPYDQRTADVWCEDEGWLGELASRWRAARQVAMA